MVKHLDSLNKNCQSYCDYLTMVSAGADEWRTIALKRAQHWNPLPVSAHGIPHLAWWVVEQWQSTAFLTFVTLHRRCHVEGNVSHRLSRSETQDPRERQIGYCTVIVNSEMGWECEVGRNASFMLKFVKLSSGVWVMHLTVTLHVFSVNTPVFVGLMSSTWLRKCSES